MLFSERVSKEGVYFVNEFVPLLKRSGGNGSFGVILGGAQIPFVS